MELHNAHCVRSKTGISTAPVLSQLRQVSWNIGVPDHYRPPERPSGQKKACIKWRGNVLMIFGEIIIVCAQSRTINEYVCRIYSHLSLQPLTSAPKFSVTFKNIRLTLNIMLDIPVTKQYLYFKTFQPHAGDNQASKEMLS